jgi:hypothetical protein
MNVKTRSRLIVFLILIFPFAFFSVMLLRELSAPLPPPPPMPDPNGYVELVKAGAMVSTNSWNHDAASLEQLRETTAANVKALALARAGFSNQCQVPLEFSHAFNENHLADFICIKELAHALVTEGKLAEMEKHPDDAAQSYLDTVRLGIESAHGGILIDQMVGTACEFLGVENLQKIADKLDAKSCRETASALESLDSQRQTWDEVMQQEHDWSRRTFTGLRYEIVRLMSHKSLEKNYQKAEEKFQEQQLATRQLTMDLAARAYNLETGHPATSPADLVPDYLKAIPQDPLTGTNLVYSPR